MGKREALKVRRTLMEAGDEKDLLSGKIDPKFILNKKKNKVKQKIPDLHCLSFEKGDKLVQDVVLVRNYEGQIHNMLAMSNHVRKIRNYEAHVKRRLLHTE